MKKILLCILVAALCSATASALIVDMGPYWDRNAPNTTMQAWEFNHPLEAGVPYMPPDIDMNPWGPATLTYYPGFLQEWLPGWGGEPGVLPLSGSIEIGIPNFPEQNPFKDIMVQIVWASQTPGGEPMADGIMMDGMPIDVVGQLVGEPILLRPTGEILPGGAGTEWYHSTYLIHLEPNPQFEVIKIHGSVLLDSVIVDTICIPEPATLAIMGLGALTLLRKRR